MSTKTRAHRARSPRGPGGGDRGLGINRPGPRPRRPRPPAGGWCRRSIRARRPATTACSGVVAPTKADSVGVRRRRHFGGPRAPRSPSAPEPRPGHWRAADLPGGLTGVLGGASAPGPKDIWAVTQLSGLVLHYNGTKWSVAKRFAENPEGTAAAAHRRHGVQPDQCLGVRRLGRLSRPRRLAPARNDLDQGHRRGRRHRRGERAGVATNIWATGGNANAPQDIVEHYDGQHLAAAARRGAGQRPVLRDRRPAVVGQCLGHRVGLHR